MINQVRCRLADFGLFGGLNVCGFDRGYDSIISIEWLPHCDGPMTIER